MAGLYLPEDPEFDRSHQLRSSGLPASARAIPVREESVRERVGYLRSYASALFILVANCRSKPTNAVDATDNVRSRR